jgi:hypothetical protein
MAETALWVGKSTTSGRSQRAEPTRGETSRRYKLVPTSESLTKHLHAQSHPIGNVVGKPTETGEDFAMPKKRKKPDTKAICGSFRLLLSALANLNKGFASRSGLPARKVHPISIDQE